MKNNNEQLHNSVEDIIAKGEITKHSRAFFILRGLGITVGCLLALSLALYLGSFILFILHTQRIWLLADFGWFGYLRLFLSLPWIVVILVALLVVVIELFGWWFTPLYRRPFLYSILAVALIVTALSALIERTALHRSLVRRKHYPTGYLYNHFGRRHLQDAYFGEVLSQQTDKWQVETKDNEMVEVLISPETRFPLGRNIMPHNFVLIIGTHDGKRIFARGIRKLSPDMVPQF